MSHTDSRDAKVDSSKYAKDRPKEEKLPLEPKKPIRTPEDLADELKRNGMFDRLRKEMLRDFLRSSRGDDFLNRIEDKIDYELDHYHPSSTSSARTPPRDKADAIQAILKSLDRSSAYSRADEDFDRRTVTDHLFDIEEDLYETLRRNRRDTRT